ncbi:hypothetical protein [Methanospirillum lacunae]|uniref:Uncharacterized protein n=1 Tax=Methanospirillum lacunae TaxID=668570 RepID=A0A2V2MXE2_9EURY|nr:hypothetical protein [Methanospirillum lacunae]PWR72069.1 hypothetical protein DK846_08755 [Methanospirillum lacunae]
MVDTQRESGLSEVIGFILIIAILVVVASLYVTYVVPAHGREAEIAHMTYIKNQFVDFKMSMDSLWINSQVNTSLAQNIEMGTLGQKTEGQFVFLPLTQPIGSDGEMKVDTGSGNGLIKIEIKGLFKDTSDGVTSLFTSKSDLSNLISVNPDLYRQLLYYQSLYPSKFTNMIRIPVPVHPIITSRIPDSPNDFSSNQSITYHLCDIYPNSTNSGTYQTTSNWTASIDLLRVPAFSVPETNATAYNLAKSPYQMKVDYRYDLIMSLTKLNQSTNTRYPVFQNFTLNSSPTRPLEYWINIQDPAYGLDTLGPMDVKWFNGTLLQQYNGTADITKNWDVNVNKSVDTSTAINTTDLDSAIRSSYINIPVTTGPTSMGKFSYTGRNYYWVPQEYYYQFGGVFLKQNGSVSKLLPLVSLGVAKNLSNSDIPSVSITKLIITGEDNQDISGTTPVQVSSRVSRIWRGVVTDQISQRQYYLAPVTQNADDVIITISNLPDNTREAWRSAFSSIIHAANTSSGFQTDWAYLSSAGTAGNLTFQVKSSGGVYLDYSEVDVNIILQPVGWQGS